MMIGVGRFPANNLSQAKILVDKSQRYLLREDIIEQNGMFSFSGLSPEQVDRLKDEFAIYAVRSGRINVAGITEDNIRYLCESIVKVL